MNIASRISEVAERLPQKKSVVMGKRFYTFSEFESRSNQMAHHFQRVGITKGTRTLLFVKPCLDFSVITFALFKVGAVPVLIDPGMGMKNLLRSVKQVRPEAMVAIPRVHVLRRLLPSVFSTVKVALSPDSLAGALRPEDKTLSSAPMNEEELAAILFTSGGTGIPKGVLYTHSILDFQTRALEELFSLNHTHVDLPGFPLFALFTLAMGMTSVIPDMDPTKPAAVNPKKIVRNILENEVTFVAGSPAIWEKVARYCVRHRIQLGSVKQVVMFGAPVRGEIHELFHKVLIEGDTFTPYGATECLPVSVISGSEVLNETWPRTREGAGTCVGRAVPSTTLKILAVSDIPKASLDEVPRGQVGEIVVQGPQVTKAYFEMDDETSKAKIHVENQLWHRMGDLGYLDQENRLWFLGRKSHRVEAKNGNLFYPIEVESIFNKHPLVRRTALISVRKQGEVTPGLVIERHDGETVVSQSFMNEIIELGSTHPKTKEIAHFWLSPGFPVDVRHNIKIDRLKLSEWANAEGGIRCRAKLRKMSPVHST